MVGDPTKVDIYSKLKTEIKVKVSSV
jgi:hypothetical protein